MSGTRWWVGWTLIVLLGGCRAPAPDGTSPAEAPAAAPATKLTVYSPHGREMLEPFEQRFEADHPEIDLVWLDMGSQEVLDRLRSERANPLCDVWWGAPHTMFTQAANDGLLAAYRPTWADAATGILHDPEDRWYAQYLTPGVICYNTEALTAETAPQDWDDLLDPAWAGRILIRDPLNSGTMRAFIAAMILRQPTEEAGYEWLRRLDANTRAYPANPALLHRQIATQEGVVTVWNLRDVEIQRRTHQYPLGYVIPASGCPVVTDGLALIAGGPAPEAAKTFYEYVTATAQLLWAAEQFDCYPARPDVDHALLPERMPRSLPELALDWDRIEAEGDRWMLYWDQAIRSNR